MYSPTVIADKLRLLADADRHPNSGVPEKLWFDPQEYTRAECQEMADRLAKKDPAQGFVIPLTLEERRWIRTEKLHCTASFPYWSERYARINDWTNRLSFYTPNIAQRVVLDMWSHLEDRQLAIMLMQLKARQAGVTTTTELAIEHRTQFNPEINATIASADPGKSLKMSGIIELSLDYQPWFLVPRVTRRATAKVPGIIEFGDLNSGISIEHGSQMSGISRGSTPSVVHLSEVASFKNQESLIEASLLRAIHETPWVFFMMESTGEGRYDWWHKKWLDVKANWPMGTSRFMPCFLPWFVSRDLYPTEAWLRKQPIPGDWIPSTDVVLHARKAELFIKNEPFLLKHLGSNWQMSREQMWFYESEKNSAERNGILKIFLQEMPADDAEAFQSSGTSVFPAETIQLYDNVTRSRPPVGLYGIVCPDLPKRFHPVAREIDANKPRVAITSDWGMGDPVEGELVPLLFKGYTDTREIGKVWVYEKPDNNEAYGLGVDTSEGVGLDPAAIQVLRKGTPFRGPGQVAEFVTDQINAFNLWPVALLLATWYSPGRRQARAVIECRGNGESVQLEMRKHGWNNFHRWQRYDSKNLDPSKAQKFGWYTNVWSRDLLLDMLQSALNDNWIEIASPFFVQEMDAFEDSGGKMEAQYGAHDDRLMALGMVLISLHILELRGFQARRATGERIHAMAREGLKPVFDDPVYDPGWQARDMKTAKPRAHNRTMQQFYSQIGSRGPRR